MLTYNWKDFTVLHKNGYWVFTAELSDLQVPVGNYPTKFEIVGKTGKRVTYILTETRTYDNDGDSTCFKYLPDPVSLRRVPEAQRTAVRLWND